MKNYSPPKTCLDWKYKPQEIKRPKGKIIAADGRGPVELIHTGKRRFAVVYGLQVKQGLDRDTAAKEYGQCIFHLCECEGLFSNE